MKHQSGFTLIELMVVMIIISILASIAIPEYNDYVRRAALQEAFASLSDFKVKLEQFYQDNRSYGTVGENPPCGHDGTANRINFAPADSKFAYTCVLPNDNPQAFLVTATGSSGRATGHAFTINQSNAKTTTSFKGSAVTKSCWLVGGSEC